MSPSRFRSRTIDWRERLMQARTFGLMGLVTVLIWLLAEAESLRMEQVRAELTFKTEPETGRYIKADADFPAAVTIRLEGSTARVDQLAAQMRKPIKLEPGMEGIPIEPGRKLIDLRTVLRALPMVRESGASIADVDPQIASVTVDNLVTREAKVRVQVPPEALVEGPPEASPSMVRLRLPESAARDLPEDLTIDAALEMSSLENLPENRRSTINGVRLELPESLKTTEGARLLPSTVSVEVTLRSRTASAVLPSVPVHVRLAPTETGIWDITMPAESRLLSDVTVSGPSEIIEQIRSEKIRPIAYVPLSFEELEQAAASGQPVEKQPIFSDLPSTLRFDTKQKTVRLSVKRREAPGAAETSPPATSPR